MNNRVVAFGTLAVFLCAGSALQAQCVPEWNVTSGNPGLGGGYGAPVRGWNDGSGERLFVGGSFTSAGGSAANQYLAKWDKTTNTWSALGSGISGGFTNAFMTRLLPFNAGGGERLVAAGFFDTAGGVPSTASLAMWNGTSWEAMGTTWTGTTRGAIQSLAVWNGRLYVGGSVVNSQPAPAPPGTGWPIGGVPWQGMASWDGQSWQSHVTSMVSTVTANIFALQVFNDGSGSALFAAGRFASINGVAGTSLIAKWDGAAWSSVGGGLTATGITGGLEAMAVFNDGTGDALYVAGSPFNRTGLSTGNVAKWNGTAWSAVGAQLGTGRVTSMAAFDDGSGMKLYVGGTGSLGTNNNISRLENNVWTPVGGGIATQSVFGLGAWQNDLYVAGSYTQVNSLGANGLAAWKGCPACYANCDGSTIAPALNVNDFTCFINQYAAATTYANCDASTIAPILNVNDFTCFINRYAAGCP